MQVEIVAFGKVRGDVEKRNAFQWLSSEILSRRVVRYGERQRACCRHLAAGVPAPHSLSTINSPQRTYPSNLAAALA
jgi:hypothetical protein